MHTNHQIVRLAAETKAISQKVYAVFQRAYQVEADLLNAEDFYPLRRTARDIQTTTAVFWGCWQDDVLAGVAETTAEGRQISIDSLVVDPAFFRQGIASALLRHVLDTVSWEEAVVQTAVLNRPAVTLYQKFGFVEAKRWEIDDLDIVSFRRTK